MSSLPRLVKIFSNFTLLCLVAPILFYNGFIVPFESTKVFFLFILIECLFPIFVFLCIRLPSFRPTPKNKLTGALFAFLTAITVSAVLGVDPWNSFFGNMHRMDGLVFLYHLFFLYLYLDAILRSDRTFYKKMLWTIFAVALFSSIVGILQMTHVLQIGNDRFDNRSTSLSGNSIFFAAFLILPLFLSYGFTLSQHETKLKRIGIVISIILTLGILSTGTRGAYIGVITGILVLVIFWIRKKEIWKKKNITLIGSATILIGLVLFFSLRFLSHPGSIAYHLTHTDQDIDLRLSYWNMALKGWCDHPVFGVGPQNFYAIANTYVTPEIYKLEQSWPDKPHNQLLEILATGGIVSFTLYIFLLFQLFKQIEKIGEKKLEISRTVFAGALIAYLVQNFFAFDAIDSLVVFFSFCALISFASVQTPDSIKHRSPKQTDHLVWIMVGIPIFLITYGVFPTIHAFARLKNVITLPYPHANNEHLFQNLEKTRLSQFVFDPPALADAYQILFRQELTETQKNSPLSEEIKTSALDLFRSTVIKFPFRTNLWNNYALVYLFDATASNKPITEVAYNIAQTASQISPGDPNPLWTLALLDVKANKLDEAASLALRSINNGVSLNKADALNWLINYFVEKKDTATVAKLYEKSVAIEPTNIELLPKLAAAYAMNKQFDQSIATAKKYKTANPAAAAGVDAFIQQVNQSR